MACNSKFEASKTGPLAVSIVMWGAVDKPISQRLAHTTPSYARFQCLPSNRVMILAQWTWMVPIVGRCIGQVSRPPTLLQPPLPRPLAVQI
jgi:hypothetical protein